MKAIECTSYGPPEVLRLTEVEKPRPGDKGILIRMHATAVTASDCIVRGFKLPRRTFGGIIMGLVLGMKKPRNPILGMIVSGEVVTTGKKVTRFNQGDRVYGWTLSGGFAIRFGAYAQYICLPEDSVIVTMPGDIPFENAAAIPYGALIALHYLKKGNIHQRKKVLIYGASGAIGTAAVQLAAWFGSEVTGVCSTRNLEMVRSLGAESVMDYTREEAPVFHTEFDLILDAVGRWKDSTFKQLCRNALAHGGRYLSVDDGSPKAKIADLEQINEIVREGRFLPVIDTRYALEDMVEAHRHVDTGHKKGNVVITVQ